MKILEWPNTAIKKCDICGAIAYYDAPTVGGPWAYMCKTCYRRQSAKNGLGSEFKYVDPKSVKQRKEPDLMINDILDGTIDINDLTPNELADLL